MVDETNRREVPEAVVASQRKLEEVVDLQPTPVLAPGDGALPLVQEQHLLAHGRRDAMGGMPLLRSRPHLDHHGVARDLARPATPRS